MPDRLKIDLDIERRFLRALADTFGGEPGEYEQDDISHQICVRELDECTCAACQLEARAKGVRMPRA